MNVIQTPRQCVRIRPLLDAYVSSELLAETNVDVLRHLDECPECTTFTGNRIQSRQLLKRAVSTIEVPAKLRTTIVSGLSRPLPSVKPRRWVEPRHWQAVAAGVALAILSSLVFGTVQRNASRTDRFLTVGWTDHARCALGAGLPDVAPSRESMMASLGGDYNVLLSVADRKLGDYRIRQGHRCRIQGREYAHLVLQKETSLMSVTVARKEAGDEFATPWFGSREVASGTKAGIAVAGFEVPAHFVYVLSNDPSPENQRVAEAVLPSMRSMFREQ